jgi:hypothetical protein
MYLYDCILKGLKKANETKKCSRAYNHDFAY